MVAEQLVLVRLVGHGHEGHADGDGKGVGDEVPDEATTPGVDIQGVRGVEE